MEFSKTNELWPYPETKDSGVKWLGRVPSHWGVLPNRTLFEEVKERNHPEAPMLSVTIKRGVILQNQLLEDSTKKDGSNLDKSAYKLVRPGDIAYNKMRAWQGAVGASGYQGIVSPAYVVQRPRDGVNSDFVHFLFRTPGFAKEAERWSYGITSDMWSLRPEHFKMIYTCLPPVCEQTAIVRFLDHADKRIQRYIRAKQKLIAFLDEQKQAIIHQAVTGQIDVRNGQRYPSYRPCCIEWLCDIPEHWEIRPFSRLAVEKADYRGATPPKTESGVFLVTAKNIRKGWIDYEASREFVSDQEYSNIMRRGFPLQGDLLLTTEAPLGHAALVDREDIALAQRVIRFRFCSDILRSEYALHSVLDWYFQNQLICRGTGSTAVGIKASKLPQLRVLCPPLNEQHAILIHIANVVGRINSKRKAVVRQVELITEYRTRLIADVVTGKLDVREAAAGLPEDDIPGDDEESPDEYAIEMHMTV